MSKADKSFVEACEEDHSQSFSQIPKTRFRLSENQYDPKEELNGEVLGLSHYNCRQHGGIHITWLHYLCLCTVICFLSVVIAIWTTVALQRTDTTPHISGFQFLSPEYWHAESVRPLSNAINFSPHIVVGGLSPNDQPVTTVISTLVTLVPSISPATMAELQPVSVVILPYPPSKSLALANSGHSAPADLKPNVDITSKIFGYDVQSVSSSSSSQLSTKIKEETTAIDVKTTIPTSQTVVPSTRYFSPPTSMETGASSRPNKWEAIGGGIQ